MITAAYTIALHVFALIGLAIVVIFGAAGIVGAALTPPDEPRGPDADR